jgi:hypothetical protein
VLKHILERNNFFSQEVDWKRIKFVRLESEGNLMNLGVILPGESEPSPGIVLTLQVIHDYLYQPHITIDEDLRGKGLATKIYRALIDRLGHLYSGKGRRQNPIVDKIWAKLRNDNTIACASSQIGDACWTLDNPDGEDIRNFIEG